MENIATHSTCSILLLPSLLGVDRTWLVSKRQSSPREVLTWKIVDKRFRGLKSISGEPSPPKAWALAGLMAECRRISFFIRSPFVHSSSTSWSTLLGSDGGERQDVIVGLVRLSVFCNKAYKQIARQGHHPPSHQTWLDNCTLESAQRKTAKIKWFGCSWMVGSICKYKVWTKKLQLLYINSTLIM